MKYRINQWVYVLIDFRIYCMIIEKCEITERSIFYTLIHSKSDYNNKKTFNEDDVFENIEDLKNEYIERIKNLSKQ